MKKAITKRRKKELSPELRKRLRKMRGIGILIKEVKGPDPAFTSRVLAGKKAPSQRWLHALDVAMRRMSILATLEMVAYESQTEPGQGR